MAKLHHSELKDLQNTRNGKWANKVFKTQKFTRPNGTPMTGVDITYAACFRNTRVAQ